MSTSTTKSSSGFPGESSGSDRAGVRDESTLEPLSRDEFRGQITNDPGSAGKEQEPQKGYDPEDSARMVGSVTDRRTGRPFPSRGDDQSAEDSYRQSVQLDKSGLPKTGESRNRSAAEGVRG